jgi:UDP-N-acetylglucosamine--N-acetylmuramyl-(pentapeptide) pyrophosphoryl-undecaprenol N-acetylglucosamine transferase
MLSTGYSTSVPLRESLECAPGTLSLKGMDIYKAMRMIITGGGTGGHLFPGIAVAQAIQQRFPAGEVMFISTDRSIDNKALSSLQLQKRSISCLGIKGKSILGTIKAMAKLPLSLWQAIKIVKGFKPDLVLGVGGYVTGPVVLAAKMLGIKTCIHEQNSVPGITNRILGKIVNRIYTSIPGSENFFADKKTVLTGNPIRKEILAVADQRPEKYSESKTLLVLGGSQGAHRVNKLLKRILLYPGQGRRPWPNWLLRVSRLFLSLTHMQRIIIRLPMRSF